MKPDPVVVPQGNPFMALPLSLSRTSLPLGDRVLALVEQKISPQQLQKYLKQSCPDPFEELAEYRAAVRDVSGKLFALLSEQQGAVRQVAEEYLVTLVLTTLAHYQEARLSHADTLLSPLMEACKESAEAAKKAGPVGEIVHTLLELQSRVDEFGLNLKRLVQEAAHASVHVSMDERQARAQECFLTSLRCNETLKKVDELPVSWLRDQLSEAVDDCRRRVYRYNRESPIFLAQGPMAAVPIGEFRNFLRSDTERMYFIALHGLPTAYDLFCITYTETPKGYRQELHLHQHSREITLLLSGSADCVWYKEQIAEDGGRNYREVGRKTAKGLEAFRIPVQVVHTVENPEGQNRNLTVKLTMFIDDRIGQNEWQFNREEKLIDEIQVDPGELRRQPWGKTLSWRHHFQGLNFVYRIDILDPHMVMNRNTLQERYHFLFAGNAMVRDCKAHEVMNAPNDHVIRLQKGLRAQFINQTDEPVMLFSVEGLDYDEFCRHRARFSAYPTWFLRDTAWIFGEQQ